MKLTKIIIQFGKIVRYIDPESETFNKNDGMLVSSLEYENWKIYIRGNSLIVSGLSERTFPLEDGTLYLCDGDGEDKSPFSFFRSKDLISMFEKFNIYKFSKKPPRGRYTYRADTYVKLYTDGVMVRKDLKNTIIFNVTDQTFVLEELIDEDGSIFRILTTKEDPLVLEHLLNNLIDKR